MRFRDLREGAEAAVKGTLHKDTKNKAEHARRIVRQMNQFPQPERAATIGEGDKRRPLTYGSDRNREFRRTAGMTRPRTRFRGSVEPHWFPAYLKERASERALLAKLVEEDKKFDE